MKHIQRKTVLLGSVLGVAVGLFAGALVLGERLSPPVSGLCFGVAGILGGVAGSRLIMARVERNWTEGDRAGGAGRAQCDHPGEGGVLQLVLEPVSAVGAVAADPGDTGRDVCGLCVGGHRAALYFLHGQCRALVPADVTYPVPGGSCSGKRLEKTRKRRNYGAISEGIPFSPGGDAVGGG